MRGGEPAVRKVKVPGVRALLVVAVVLGALVASPDPGWAKPGVPSAPKSVKPLPGNGRAKVSWQPPYSNGGHKVTQYKVIAYHGDVALAVNVFHSTATSQFIVGLKNGQAYAFTVSAKNSVGWSAFSARSSTVKVGIPIPPPPPSAVAGVGQATVSWHPPVNNGSAVDSYRVTPYLAGATQPDRVFKASKTKQLIAALKHGKRYQFKVSAHNKIGWSAPSAVSDTIVVK